MYNPKDERPKLDVKTRQGVFIGFVQDQFGYKFYDTIEKKIVRSWDVVFIEDESLENIDKAKKIEC